MVDALIFKSFEAFLNCAVKPVKRHLSNAFRLKSKISELEMRLNRLEDQKQSLQHEVDDASRQGNEIERFASNWLTRVEEIAGKGRELLEKAGNLPCGIKLKKRWKLGQQAAMKSQEIAELLEEKSRFGQVWFRAPPQQILQATSEVDMPSSRMMFLEEIKTKLQSPDVRIVGCYGMGGSGKTTLAEELHRQATLDKLFERSIIHTVTSKPEISKIQQSIADFLSMRLEEETERVRASRLHQRLVKETKLLIILDDLWEVLDLQKIGIPSNVKLFLTSRNMEVLDSMNSSSNFSLEDLPSNEAMDLFKSSVKKVEYPELAEKILQKCCGHPLTIVVVAGMLRGKREHVWQDTLKQLQGFHNQEISAKVYSALKLSYDSLVDKEQKDLFLLCGILGESKIKIMDLLKYCVGLRLFEQIDKMKDAWNRLLKLVDDLVSCSLLLGYDQESESVQIHDLLCDTAASIARTRKTFIIARGRKFDKWPSIEKETTRISLPFVTIDERPPRILGCPDLEFFLYQAADSKIEFSDSFFDRCLDIRVVTLSGIPIKSPLLLSGLANLRTLCLHRCNLSGEDLKNLVESKKLEVLSLRESSIESIPKKLGQLTNLKSLDFGDCRSLNVIPAGVLSKFSKLEELYVGNTDNFYWDRNGNASLSELESMRYLTCLEMRISDTHTLPEKIVYDELQRYNIYSKRRLERSIYKCELRVETNASLGQGSNALLRTVEFLHFGKVIGTKHAVFDPEARGFPKLRKLTIDDASELECFIDSTCSDFLTFPNLETLSLSQLTNLGSIWNCHLSQGSFEGLKHLYISGCRKLQYVFSISMVERLSRLEVLKVCHSNIMEGIFHCNERDVNAFVKLPKLFSLQLDSLPQYSCFVQSSQEFVATKVLFSDKILLPQLENLYVKNLPLLETLWEGQPAPDSFDKLHSITLQDCNNLKVLLSDKISLPQLDDLYVNNLPLLEALCEGQPAPHSFDKLNFIRLLGCDNLKVLFSDKILLPQLEKLVVYNVPLLEALWEG